MKQLIITVLLAVASTAAAFAQKRDSVEKFSYHVQQTLVGQSAGYEQPSVSQMGHNTFDDRTLKVSLSSTFYLGRKLWKGASLYVNPDIAGGAGLGGTVGIAGYVNGEIFRVGNPAPTLYVSRAFVRQYLAIRDEVEYVPTDQNQLGEWVPIRRFQLTIGKFSMADMFDNNKYSHDPRTRFLNWSLMNAGSYDFPSNTKGYTYGAVFECITPNLSARIGVGAEPQYSNGPLTTNRNSSMLDMEYGYNGYGATLELEWPIHQPNGKDTKVRILYFANRVNAGSYADALYKMVPLRNAGLDTFVDNASYSLASTRSSSMKYGMGINIEHPIGQHAGSFLRINMNDGQTESYAFAEIDQSASLGFVLHGTAYNRYHDRIEIAGAVNGISQAHRAYLEAGEYGFMLGEPGLKYGPEYVMEFQYVYDLGRDFTVSPDFQLIVNPGYDMNRGVIRVIGLRTHIQF